jgi:hypothetical protein
MPDFNPLAAPMPVIRPELISPGLSLIVKPKYDYINTFPDTLNADTDGNPNAFSITMPDEGVARRKKLLGEVPLTPATETDYNTSKRYNRSDLGFVGGRDNEDLYAQNQGFFSSVGHGLGRLVGLTATKTGTGLGYLAGLVGLGNDSEKYGNGFGAWVAGAGDNGIAKFFQGIEDDQIKNDWFPIYKKATESQHGFFRHMADLDFWTDDLTDGAAFMTSSFIPGIGISKLKLGTRSMKSLAALREIGAMDETSGLSKTGVEGTVESQNLLREGLGATVESPDIANTIKQTTNATQEIPRVLSWIDNAKAIRSIDVGSTSIINTASQAMYSANEAKNNAYDTLMKQKDANGQNKYTIEQAKQLSAKVAKDSYVMNLGALSLMNLWEANFMFKKASLAGKFNDKFTTNGLFGDATLAKKTWGERAFSAIKEPGKGFLTGGVWLGNMQLAIDRLNNNPDNFNLDFGDKLKALGKQYVNQTKDALAGKDLDVQKSLGIGGILGAAAGKLFGHNELNETKKSLANLNSQISAFRDLGNIYKTEADGSLSLEEGSPVLDEDKMRSWVASMNNVLSLNQVAKNFDSRGIPELAKIYQDETFARFAKAHFDAGISDVLFQKLNDVANIKKEDLALLGYDPDSQNKETPQLLTRYIKKATDLESLYNNIHQNFIPGDINLNTTAGQKKYFEMTDKMFYLSARSASLNERISESISKYDEVRNNVESYDKSYNSENDATVTKYNELFEQLDAARRRRDQVGYQQDYIDELNRKIDYERNGISVVNGPSRLERIRRNNPSVSVTLPEGIRERTESVISDREKALNEYINQNKEILERLKKDARGRYLYEVGNKNLLPSAKEMEQQQIVQAELGLANNATLNVLSRLADPKYGGKYYDQIYSKELERHAIEQGVYNDLTDDDTDNRVVEKAAEDTYNLPSKKKRGFDTLDKDEAYNQWTNLGRGNKDTDDRQNFEDQLKQSVDRYKDVDKSKITDEMLNDDIDRTKALRSFGDKEKVRKAMKEELGIDEDRPVDDIFNELSDITRERDALDEKDDRTPEEEQHLEELNEKVDSLEKQRETAFESMNDKMKIDNSINIKPEDKPTYEKVMKKIAKVRKGITKLDDYYDVNGEQYRKVTDLIGDRIPPELREEAKVQAAVNAGNYVDTFVKAYFSGEYRTDEFKSSMSDKMSEETFNEMSKSLDKLKSQLENKGIEIIGSNVFVTDDALKVAGEIDLLGVDKNGNFKIYEIQARRGDVYRQYGKRGLGIKIRDIDSKRLSMYRNMFANQYGVIPDEIAVKFPFEVKYDKTNYKGFIESAKIRDAIRFTPLKNVEIKMKKSEPLRLGSKFESVDMTKIFLDTFLTDKIDQDKLKFLFRNVKIDSIINGAKLTVKAAGEEFQKKFNLQSKALNKENVDFKIKKFRDFRNRDEFGNPKEFDNLYSLVGNTEVSLSYEGQPIGYLSPLQTLAYKDIDGNFKILDENTDAETYSNVTGNSINSYKEFQKVAAAYKKLHTELTGQMLTSPNKEVTLSGEDLKALVDLKMSQGELDLVKSKGKRPDLKDLSIPGVKVGNKMIPTVVNLDENGAVKVLMDKSKKTGKTVSKYQEVDKWANQHLDDIKKAMTDQDGEKVTDNVAIIETPSGDYKIISLRAKEGVNLNDQEDFVDNLGDKFTASVTDKVFKNQGLMIVPKEATETGTINLNDHKIVAEVYETDDIDSLEKFGLNPEHTDEKTTEQKVDEFLKDLSDKDRQTLEDFNLTAKEDIMNDYQNGEWSSIEDYIDNIKNCK